MRKIARLKAAVYAMEVVTAGSAVAVLITSAYIQWPEVFSTPLAILAVIGTMACTYIAGSITKKLMDKLDIEEKNYGKVPVRKIYRRQS